MKGAGALQHIDVLWLLDDTNGVVGAPRVGADDTARAFGDIGADLAEPDLILDVDEGARQILDHGAVAAQHPERQALRRLLADPGHLLEERDGAREKRRPEHHSPGSPPRSPASGPISR